MQAICLSARFKVVPLVPPLWDARLDLDCEDSMKKERCVDIPNKEVNGTV